MLPVVEGGVLAIVLFALLIAVLLSKVGHELSELSQVLDGNPPSPEPRRSRMRS